MQRARAFRQRHRKIAGGERQEMARAWRFASLRAPRERRKQQVRGASLPATDADPNGPEGFQAFQAFQACGEDPEATPTCRGATVWR